MSNLPAILKAVHKNGNPMATMISRTNGLDLTKTAGFSNFDIVSAVYGADFANAISENGTIRSANRLTTELFVLFCKLNMKRKLQAGTSAVSPLPIKPGSKFCAPHLGIITATNRREYIASSNLIRNADWFVNLCEPTMVPPAVVDTAMVDLQSHVPEGEQFDTWLDSVIRSQDVVATRALALSVARSMPDTFVLTDVVMPGSPSNLVPVSQNLFKYFDFCATAQDAMFVAMELTRILGTVSSAAQISYCVGEYEGSPVMFMDFEAGNSAGYRRIMIHPVDGVFEMSRMRRFGNMLVVNAEGDLGNEDMSLLSSYGVFINFVIRFATSVITEPGNTKNIGLFYDKYLKNDTKTQCPITAMKDLGALDGDRQHLDYVSAKVRNYGDRTNPLGNSVASWNPFRIQYIETGKASVETQDMKVMELGVRVRTSHNKSDIDAPAFKFFNLVRQISSTGALLDGRRACIRVEHVPAEHRAKFVSIVEDRVLDGKSWLDHAGSKYDPEEGINKLVIGLSSKVSKLIKRTAMDASVISLMKNGEERGSRIYGQRYASENNVMIPAVISQHLLGAAGNAYYWEDGMIELLVDKTFRSSPEIDCLIGADKFPVAELVDTRYETTTNVTQDGWFEINWAEQPSLAAKEEIIIFPYKIDGVQYEYAITNSIDGARLKKVAYRMANVVGRKTTLQVEVVVTNHEPACKARNHVKAVMVPCRSGVFENGLNGDAYAKAIFPADTNKWGDLVKSNTDVAAATFIKNSAHPKCARGFQLISEINKSIGCEGFADLVWSPTAAVLGVYDELLAEFSAQFGRDIWTLWNDGQEGSWHELLHRLYVCEETPVEGWYNIDPMLFGFMGQLSNVKVIADSKEIKDGTNIFVFAESGNDGSKIILQRGFSFVGTEDCPVYQPIKGELSSVIDNIGFADTMAGVVRAIAKDDARTAATILREGERRIHKSAAFHMMSRGVAADGLEVITTSGTLSETAIETIRCAEAVEIVTSAEYKGKILKSLAKVYGDTFFVFRFQGAKVISSFSINLAILCAQDANQDFASEESLSAVVEYLFREIILGTNNVVTDNAGSLLARVDSKIKNLVESDGLNKACAFGGPVLGARAAGVPGIPVGEIWIAESRDPRSVYAKFLSGFSHILKDLGKVSEVKVFGYRAPMTSPMYQKVIVVRSDDARHEKLSPYMLNMNVVINNIHGGDYDGDSNYIAPLVYKTADGYVESEVALTTLETIIDAVRTRTGSDQLAAWDDYNTEVVNGGAYYADHNEVKSRAAIIKKNGVSGKNLVLSENKGGEDISTMSCMLTRSTEMIKEAVGRTHTFVLQADLFASLKLELIKWGIVETGDDRDWVFKPGILSILYEIYEVPLGGLDDAAYEVLFKFIIPMYTSGRVLPLSDKYVGDGQSASLLEDADLWKSIMDEAGMCSDAYNEVMDACVEIYTLNNVMTKDAYGLEFYAVNSDNLINDHYDLISAAVWLSFKMSKGALNPTINNGQVNKAYKVLMDVINYIKSDANLAKIVTKSTILRPIVDFAVYMAPAMTGEVVNINMDLFINTDGPSNDTDGNSDNNDPSPTPSPSPLSEEVHMPTNADNFTTWVQALPAKVRALPEWKMMSNDQLMAVYIICSGTQDCVTLTGKAGSGKSFTVQFAAKVLDMLGKEVHVTGTTGVATINAGGANTINSLTKIARGKDDFLPIGHYDRSNRANRNSISRAASQNFKAHGPEVVIFIDETSMASPENLVLAYQSIHKVIGNKRPFRFVLVGDFRQLAPVEKKGDVRFAFENAVFNVCDDTKGDYRLEFGSFMTTGPFNLAGDKLTKEWKTISLSLLTNHRQNADNPDAGLFIDALNALGEGRNFNDQALIPLMKRVFVRTTSGQYVNVVTSEALGNTDAATHAFTNNADVKGHNAKIQQIETSKPGCQMRRYKAKIVSGAWKTNEILRNVAPIEAEQMVYKGQKFMVRVNVPNSPLKNGTVGTVFSLQNEKIGIKLPDGEKQFLGMESYPLPDTLNGPAGEFSTPAMGHGANGSTIWKLQGITIKNSDVNKMESSLVVNLKRSPFKGKADHGLAYVFCSRVQSADQLFILVDDLNYLNQYVHCDPKVQAFIQVTEENMRNLLKDEQHVDSEKRSEVVSIVKSRRNSESQNVGVIVSIDGRFIDVRYTPDMTLIGIFERNIDNRFVEIKPAAEEVVSLIELTQTVASEVE